MHSENRNALTLDAICRGWRGEARKALDSWVPSSEVSVALALSEAFEKGIAFAASVLDEQGHSELARRVRSASRTRLQPQRGDRGRS